MSESFDPRYRAYFARFNRQQFFEAHEELESLWLTVRHSPDARFYQGLIMVAGAFVHFQKGRPRAAAKLLRLARERLQPFGDRYKGLDVRQLVELLDGWLRRTAAAATGENPYDPVRAPKLELSDV